MSPLTSPFTLTLRPSVFCRHAASSALAFPASSKVMNLLSDVNTP